VVIIMTVLLVHYQLLSKNTSTWVNECRASFKRWKQYCS